MATKAEPVINDNDWLISAPGVLMASLLFAASLTPSLIPREAAMQGVLAGLSATLGYAIGALAMWLWRIMLLPEPGERLAPYVRWPLFAISLAVCMLSLWYAADWQNATRAVMDLRPVPTAHPLTVSTTAFLVFGFLWLAGSAFLFATRRAGRALARILPGRTGPVMGILVGVALSWALIDGVLIRNFMEAADASFEAADLLIDPETSAPDDPMMTGSSASLVRWEQLGANGRDFIASMPSRNEITEFSGDAAMRPIRVYVGRRSARTARARAKLALAETIRVGGFDREVLVITTPVGTGWMDPGSHDALDFMFGGNATQVAVQYSYLISYLSILTHVDYGFDQARALFDVFYAYWTTLPEDDRPRLYVHGLSQGALNSQATLPFLDTLGDPPNGALWAGSPFLSPLWARIRDDRNPESPAWRPRYGNGSLVRVTNQDNVLDEADAPWGPVRFVFLHYGSDPIVVFDFATIWRAPDWLSDPRAPDVAPQMRWYPAVTAFQIGLDMLAALNVEGYGHYYVAEDYIDAWAALADPPGWTEARADQLKAIFERRPPSFTLFKK